MSAYSEVVWTIRCDYPDCYHESGPDPNLNTLRADAASEENWTTDGESDYCEDHRATWESEL